MSFNRCGVCSIGGEVKWGVGKGRQYSNASLPIPQQHPHSNLGRMEKDQEEGEEDGKVPVA